MRLFKHGFLLAVSLVASVLVAVMLALPAAYAVGAGAMTVQEVEPAYAILYSNGDLVLQRGDATDASRGRVVASYTGFEDSYYSIPWSDYSGRIKSVVVADDVAPVSTEYWFYDCTNLRSADLSGLDTSNVVSMGYMFSGCSSLESLDVSGWDTSAVTDMGGMFHGCSSLESLDVSGFDTSNVVSMGYMFSGCSSLTSLDVSGFDTSGVTDMHEMFSGCSSLESLDVSGWDTWAVTSMGYMFSGCSSLESLDVSGWDTSAVTDMDYMFEGCDSLASIKLGESFSFYGSRGYPLTALPGGLWQRVPNGKVYTADELADAYDGSKMAGTYKRVDSSLSKAVIAGISDQAYTGYAIEPDVTVTLYGKTLEEFADYTVTYANNVEAGTATVTVTGEGSYYTGTKSVTFVVKPASLASADVRTDLQWYTYTGKALKPVPEVTLDWETLEAGTDYTVSYKNNVNVGTATVTVTGRGNYSGTATGTFEIVPAPDEQWSRLAGDDRLGTMQAITKAGYSKADTVLVTTGWGDADALTAAGLSGILGAPILTTAPSELSPQASSEVKRLGAKEAIILGGTSAVSPKVEKQLKGMGLKVSRLTGNNRIETALKIYAKGGDAWGDTCILSKGWVSADALAAGSYAYANRAPIFLAMPDGSIDANTAKAMKSFKHVIVLGGTQGAAAIRLDTVKSLGVSSWMRLAGDTRYDTAVQLATWATGGNPKAAFQPEVELSWQDAAVAFAWNYPDALVGVNVTGPKGSVTLLASKFDDNLTRDVATAVMKHSDEVSHGYILGGKAVVSDVVLELFEQIAAGEMPGPSFVGTWVISSMEADGEYNNTATLSSVLQMAPRDIMSLELYANGRADMTAFGESISKSSGGVLNWSLTNTGVTLSNKGSNQTIELIYNDDVRTLRIDDSGTTITFSKYD